MSKYVRETGKGYQSIHSVSDGRATVSLATIEEIDWCVGEEIVATPHDHGVVLQPATATDQEPLGSYVVGNQGHGPNVSVGRTAIRTMEPVDECRVYAHAKNELLLVDADNDPCVMADGSGLQRETFLDVDDLLELAQEQAEDERVLYHIRSARSVANAKQVLDEDWQQLRDKQAGEVSVDD